jgi:Mg/Co/Ni transporter MgtE
MITPHRRSRIELQLRFPPGSIGELMDTEVSAYPVHWPLGRLRAALGERPLAGPSYVYVVDEHSGLVGVVGPAEMDHPDTTPLGKLMRTRVESVYAYASVDSVLDHPGWRQHDRLPVTSAGRLFVGALRHRDLRQRRSVAGAPGSADLGDVLMTVSQVWWEGMWTALDGLAGGDRAREGR